MSNPMSKEDYEQQKERIANDERYPAALKEWLLEQLEKERPQAAHDNK